MNNSNKKPTKKGSKPVTSSLSGSFTSLNYLGKREQEFHKAITNELIQNIGVSGNSGISGMPSDIVSDMMRRGYSGHSGISGMINPINHYEKTVNELKNQIEKLTDEFNKKFNPITNSSTLQEIEIVNIVKFVLKRLGDPIVSVELTPEQITECYQEAKAQYFIVNKDPNIKIPYKKEWIRQFCLALCMETLGLIRGKMKTISIPGGESVELNSDQLLKISADMKLNLLNQIAYEPSRKFNIEIGNVTDEEKQQLLKDTVKELQREHEKFKTSEAEQDANSYKGLRRPPIVDPITGELNPEYHHLTSLEDYVYPIRERWFGNSTTINISKKNIPSVVDFVEELKIKVAPVFEPLAGQYPTKIENEYNSIPFKLFEFQKDLLNSFENSKYNIVQSQRQMGLTHCLAAYALYYAYKNPNSIISINTYKNRTTEHFFEIMNFMIRDSIYINEVNSDDFENRNTKIKFKNGSKICSYSDTVVDYLNTKRYYKSKEIPSKVDLTIADTVEYFIPKKQTQEQLDQLGKIIYGMSGYFNPDPNDSSELKHFGEIMYEAAQENNSIFKATHLKWSMHPYRDKEWAKQKIDHIGVKAFIKEFGEIPKQLDPDLESKILYLEEQTIGGHSKTNGLMSSDDSGHKIINLLIGDKIVIHDFKIDDRDLFLSIIKAYNEMVVGI